MSKRHHGAGGAFDALVQAFAGLGAGTRWARLPRATAPGSLGRSLGQGVLEGRLPKAAHGACAAEASPLPVHALRNEAQRSIAEFGAILWHALGGTHDAPEFAPWMAPPHSDPIVALSLSRRLLAEYAAPEVIDPTCALPGQRVWLVEVEHPRDDEPNAAALWEEDGAEVALAAFLCDDDGGGASFPTVVTWRTTSEGERSRAGGAALKGLIHADNPGSTESRADAKRGIDALAAVDSGAIARAKTAIAMHLENDGRATPLASYRASTGSASTQRHEVTAGRRSITALFAIERAPEPEPPEERTTAEGHGRGGNGRRRTQHHVRAHSKRQAYGPKRSKRRWIVVEGYARGPEPEEDQIAITRLPEGRLPTQDEPASGKRATYAQANEEPTRSVGRGIHTIGKGEVQ